MVESLDPQLGETILDPACGTAGFLVESYTHLEKQCKTVEHFKVLQEKSIFGGEAKPLPYMLAQMNLLLHGLRSPRVAYGNSLAVKLTEIGNRDRVDVILTNPPSAARKRRGFAATSRPTSRLRKRPAVPATHHAEAETPRQTVGERPSRPASSCLTARCSATACAPASSEDLLTEFNLHTVVRLPNGVFAPYTSIPTNLLFFDRSGPTEDDLVLRAAVARATKELLQDQTHPVRGVRRLPEVVGQRKENERAWRVPAAELLARSTLDRKNPARQGGHHAPPPEQLVEDIFEKERRIIEIMGEINTLLGGEAAMTVSLAEMFDLARCLMLSPAAAPAKADAEIS